MNPTGALRAPAGVPPPWEPFHDPTSRRDGTAGRRRRTRGAHCRRRPVVGRGGAPGRLPPGPRRSDDGHRPAAPYQARPCRQGGELDIRRLRAARAAGILRQGGARLAALPADHADRRHDRFHRHGADGGARPSDQGHRRRAVRRGLRAAHVGLQRVPSERRAPDGRDPPAGSLALFRPEFPPRRASSRRGRPRLSR